MKNFLALLALLILTTGSFAQKKYQGLLWEISGNGLDQPSYLYGTMHVSNKLAFNVSDSFYLCLNRADGIALESSPANWMEDYRDMGSFSGGYNWFSDFYSGAFQIAEPSNGIAYDLMQNKNGLMNQILYRFNRGNEDYQEDTFLDMFIYQAGAKNEKPIYSLETLREVIDLSILAMKPDEDKEYDNGRNNYLETEGTQKFMMLEEAYRRGDLDQIDSLSKANNPTSSYHHYFIVERNRNMVRRIDSILNINTLFVGIGAAHLPGEEGAIELLRDMGYKVRAVNPKSSGKSHKMRQKLQDLYRPVTFTPYTSEDGFITTSVPGTFYEMPSGTRGRMEYLCPEPINGGYFSVVRKFTFGPIFNKDAEYYKTTFDSLLYIATPGELIKKEDISINGHKGYRILTETSKNALVNYHVFFTPTEVMVFKGYGNGDYILKNGPKSFFSNIKMKPNSSEWHDVAPKFGGAKWRMKGLVTGQDMIDGLEDTEVDPLYQAYDQETGDYSIVMRYVYNDLEFIEEDSFDLAYLGKSFGENLGYEVDQSNFFAKSGYSYVVQDLKPDEDHKDLSENLSIKVLVQGGAYYLMASTATGKNKTDFFDSFTFADCIIDNEYTMHEDTTLFYTVETIIEDEMPSLADMRYRYRSNSNDDEEDKNYLSDTKSSYHYLTKSGESIYVGYTKFHDYQDADSLSDFWEVRTNFLTRENGLVVSQREESMLGNDQMISFILTDTASSRGIMTRLILHHGVEYTVQALIDTTAGPSPYVAKFFETFAPMDTLIGRDLFEDKGELFIAHAFGEDSLNRVNAMKSINTVDFIEKDIPEIIRTYNTFEFDEETEQDYREKLIMTLGNMEEQEAYDFLFAVYDSNNFNSDLQFTALKCFSYTETEEAYDGIKKLLLTNPPFTEQRNKLFFFDNLYDSLELAKDYYPEMLELVQYSDYHPYVMELLATGYLKEIFTYSDFKSQKSSLFRNANIELKRIVANQKKGDDNSYSYYRTNQYTPYHNLFLDYYTLMCGFKKNNDPDVNKFFQDIYRIEDEKFQVEAEIIHYKLGLPVDKEVFKKVAEGHELRLWVYNRLEDNEMLHLFDKDVKEQDMAFAILYNYGYDEEEDSVVFVRREYIDNGKDTGYVYFFKRKEEKKKNWMIDYVGLIPERTMDGDSIFFDFGNQETKKGLAFKNEDEMEQTIERTIEIFGVKNRKRVVVESYDYGSLFGGFY